MGTGAGGRLARWVCLWPCGGWRVARVALGGEMAGVAFDDGAKTSLLAFLPDEDRLAREPWLVVA